MDVDKNVCPDDDLKSRVHNLEEDMETLQHNFDILLQFHTHLDSLVSQLKGGSSIGEIESGEELFEELKTVSTQRSGLMNGTPLAVKMNGMNGTRVNGTIPLNAKKSDFSATARVYVPVHLRKSSQTDSSNATKQVSLSPEHQTSNDVVREHQHSAANNTRNNTPSTQHTSTQDLDLSVEVNTAVSDKIKMPHYISTLPALSCSIKASIPTQKMVTFHPDFIQKAFGGTLWSPGLNYIIGRDSYIVKCRSYYTLDPATEPFLPKDPGEHGAKLTAFFNESPRDAHGDPSADADPYENVPMFVLIKNRFVYFGNYSQTRWSDKLDYDTMETKIPKHVKQYWATELTAEGRPKWITEQLKQHFFPQPVYEGYIPTTSSEGTTIATEEGENKAAKDVNKYINLLGNWARDANMKTALLSAKTILDSFQLSDADYPPALRLWWEYLECVSWNKNLYDQLAKLQSREGRKYVDEK